MVSFNLMLWGNGMVHRFLIHDFYFLSKDKMKILILLISVW